MSPEFFPQVNQCPVLYFDVKVIPNAKTVSIIIDLQLI